MAELITVAQADRHLRLNLQTDEASPPTYTDERLSDLEMKIEQAEAIILNYLNIDGAPLGSPPSWTDRDVKCVQASVLLALEALYDADKDRTLADYMVMNTGVIALLLMRLRDPTLA